MNKKNSSFFSRYQAIDLLALMSANAGVLGWNSAWSGSGQNLAYRRSEYDRIGGFSPVMNQISGDDMYLIQTISKNKRAIFNASREGFVTTSPSPTIKTYFSQRIRWASNAQKLISKNICFLLFLISTFICNVLLLAFAFLYLDVSLLFFLFLLKAFFDGFVIFIGSKRFFSPVSLLDFTFWFMVQPLYVPVVGVLGLVGVFSWKK